MPDFSLTFLKGTLRGGKAVRKEIHRGSEVVSEKKKFVNPVTSSDIDFPEITERATFFSCFVVVFVLRFIIILELQMFENIVTSGFSFTK